MREVDPRKLAPRAMPDDVRTERKILRGDVPIANIRSEVLGPGC